LKRGASFLKEAKDLVVEGKAGGHGRVFRPEWWLVQRWDAWMASCLCFVCLVTPVEVAFNVGGDDPALRFINRILDVAFLIDICVQSSMPAAAAAGVGEGGGHTAFRWPEIPLGPARCGSEAYQREGCC
jgi:hypothetical protein